nr:hypothetical protein [Shigella sp. FC1967]
MAQANQMPQNVLSLLR